MSAQHPFDLLLDREDVKIRLAEASLLFALDRYPSLKVGQWLNRLDRLALRVEKLGARTAPDQVAALRTVLVVQEQLLGNSINYYDPRNSYLNDVLDRRLGIPITLSVVWLDVAAELNWCFSGIPLPGRFIVRCDTDSREILIDPFPEGVALRREDCDRMVSAYYGRPVTLADSDYARASVKTTIARMLNNLRLIYAQQQAWHHLANVLRRLLAIRPDSQELQSELEAVLGHAARLN